MADTIVRDKSYLITEDGRVEFTDKGREFHTAYFGYAGIDIRTIKTEADLERAEEAAFPYIFPFMAQYLKKRPQALGTRALRAVVEGDWNTYEDLFSQLLARERLTVLSGSRDASPDSP